ncbi:MAG: hypothetical protein AAF471_09645 [Myxococcota bacterium]
MASLARTDKPANVVTVKILFCGSSCCQRQGMLHDSRCDYNVRQSQCELECHFVDVPVRSGPACKKVQEALDVVRAALHQVDKSGGKDKSADQHKGGKDKSGDQDDKGGQGGLGVAT